jgi:hypothetical protein
VNPRSDPDPPSFGTPVFRRRPVSTVHGNLHGAEAVSRHVEIADAVLEPGVIRVEQVGDEILLAAHDSLPLRR